MKRKSHVETRGLKSSLWGSGKVTWTLCPQRSGLQNAQWCMHHPQHPLYCAQNEFTTSRRSKIKSQKYND